MQYLNMKSQLTLKILCIIFVLRYEGIKTADDLADFVNAEAGDDNSVTESWYI